MNKTLVFDSKIVEVEETTNPLLSKVKIRIAYWGLNRNNSNINKEVFEEALPSIYNCPIVGGYLTKNEDFGDHGGEIVRTSTGLEYKQTTIPYGVINDKTEISWEILPDENGDDREYLCATGYIWTGRYKELESVVEDSKGQSMEIEILESEFIEIDGKQVEDIKKFIFSGFCILGDDVEPCFEDANIAAFTLDETKEYFRAEFRKMIFELKEHLSAEFQRDDDKNKIDEEGGDKVKDKNFSFSSEQLENELRIALRKIKVNDYGWEYSRYCFEDYLPDKNIVIAWDWDKSYNIGMSYTVEGDVVTIDTTTAKRYKAGEWTEMNLPEDVDDDDNIVTNFNKIIQEKTAELADMEKLQTELGKYKKEADDFKKKYNHLTTDFTNVKQELADTTAKFEEITGIAEQTKAELEQFKKDKEEEQEQALFERFADQFTAEEFEAAKEDVADLSIEQKEEKLFALVGKKAAKFSRKNDTGLLNIRVFNKENEEDPYGGLLSQE